MQSPPIYLIFWGSQWDSSAEQALKSSIENSVTDILSGPYLSGLKQYGSDGIASYAGSVVNSSATPNKFSHDNIQDVISNAIENQGLPEPDDVPHAPIYVVVTPPGIVSDVNGAYGYNGGFSSGGFLAPDPAVYAWVGVPANENVGAVTIGFSHEIAEAVSDPAGNGITVTAPAGLPGNLRGSIQIGDNEPDDYRYVQTLNGPHGPYTVQAYWSRQDNAFIVPDGTPQKSYLYPIWNGNIYADGTTPLTSYVVANGGKTLGALGVDGTLYVEHAGNPFSPVDTGVSSVASGNPGTAFAGYLADLSARGVLKGDSGTGFEDRPWATGVSSFAFGNPGTAFAGALVELHTNGDLKGDLGPGAQPWDTGISSIAFGNPGTAFAGALVELHTKATSRGTSARGPSPGTSASARSPSAKARPPATW
jgi:hypothetical protein